ncbi:MAG: galactokinase [Caeruleum heppii]|nr:MAG: galactokinase [Caeruleum heppii]
MADNVPTATSLDEIYPEEALSGQSQRWRRLLAAFDERYGRSADFVSRSPGRVNIIGEHIDYSLYDVLPMAVTVDLLLAVSIRPVNTQDDKDSDPMIRIENVQSHKFNAQRFTIPPHGHIPIDDSSGEWQNYFKAGLRGAVDLLRKKQKKDESFMPVGMDVLVDGSVPSGGGLSSSAAFVCASALAVLKANGEEAVSKQQLVDLAIVSERAVGVNSGGMDQAASVFAVRGDALYVSFDSSLTARPIPLPKTDPEMTFLVAQSFVAADKHVTGPVCYNLRVVECSLAAECLAKLLDVNDPLPEDAGPLGVSLRGLQNAYFRVRTESGGDPPGFESEHKQQLKELLRLTQDNLTQTDGYTREEIAEILGISGEELQERYMSKFPIRAERFLLRHRAMHVFSEAIRVLEFMSLLSASDPPSNQLPKQLGAIMNETQRSCREFYDCSCPELDEICQLALDAGAYGSRLTGAGWGGCSVHLVPQEKVDAVKEAWTIRYYRKRFPGMTEEKLAEAVVISKPGSGSCLFDVKGSDVT